MNVAKCLLLAIFVLPVAELAAFVAVAAQIGVLMALTLVVLTSFAGLLILRHAGGAHIARMRVALQNGRFTALQADNAGGRTLLAGILLLVPGFITDALGLMLLVTQLGALSTAIGGRARPRADEVVDLNPDQWRRVPDPELPDRRDDRRDA